MWFFALGALTIRENREKRISPVRSPNMAERRAKNWESKGAFVWDQSGIRIIGIMQGKVCLAALPIPEYLDFHSGYSAPRSRIGRINSRIYSYSRIFPNEHALSFNCVRVQRRTGIFGYFFLKDIVFSL